ncbi:T9SS type A sorting domain-containing protein [Flavobacteriales bacterium]|nr:T9SS type A sorting domain-containing protein [Flavobacteriales bacterium]
MKYLLILLLILLMGESVFASRTRITSQTSGNWRDVTTWDLGRTPENGDIVVIDALHTVTVISNNGTCNGAPDTHLYVNGTLTFSNGSKLRLGCASSVTIEVGGLLAGGSGGGSSKKLYICENEQWNSSDPDVPGFYVFGKPLPIELMDFSAEVSDNNILLEWVTAAEENNDYFEILRSKNGLSYEIIGQVYGSGTTNNTMFYEFDDYDPIDGLSYYMLRQTDYDGKSESFSPIAVEFTTEPDGSCVLTVYPNPCPGNCKAKLNECPNGSPQVRLMMTDATGHMVSEVYDSRNFDGSFDIHIDKTNNLKPGVYVISAIIGEENISEKIILK